MGADPRIVTVRDCRLYLTDHAVERYRERVKSWLTFDEAVSDLRRVLPMAEAGERPPWAVGRRDASGWVTLTGGITFPVVGNRLMTCITRSEAGAELRLVREPRGDRARRARKRRKQHGKVARGERHRARDRRAPDA